MSEHLTFTMLGLSQSGKTSVWRVARRDGEAVLGTVRWWGAWRKYVFEPREFTIYDSNCLRSISEFCDEVTVELKKSWKASKS